MHCEKAEMLLPLLVFDELADAEKTELMAHLAGCSSCSEKLGDLRVTLNLLREGVAAEPAPVLSVDRRAKLMKKLAVPPKPRRSRRTQPLKLPAWVTSMWRFRKPIGIAAGLAIIASIGAAIVSDSFAPRGDRTVAKDNAKDGRDVTWLAADDAPSNTTRWDRLSHTNGISVDISRDAEPMIEFDTHSSRGLASYSRTPADTTWRFRNGESTSAGDGAALADGVESGGRFTTRVPMSDPKEEAALAMREEQEANRVIAAAKTADKNSVAYAINVDPASNRTLDRFSEWSGPDDSRKSGMKSNSKEDGTAVWYGHVRKTEPAGETEVRRYKLAYADPKAAADDFDVARPTTKDSANDFTDARWKYGLNPGEKQEARARPALGMEPSKESKLSSARAGVEFAPAQPSAPTTASTPTPAPVVPRVEAVAEGGAATNAEKLHRGPGEGFKQSGGAAGRGGENFGTQAWGKLPKGSSEADVDKLLGAQRGLNESLKGELATAQSDRERTRAGFQKEEDDKQGLATGKRTDEKHHFWSDFGVNSGKKAEPEGERGDDVRAAEARVTKLDDRTVRLLEDNIQTLGKSSKADPAKSKDGGAVKGRPSTGEPVDLYAQLDALVDGRRRDREESKSGEIHRTDRESEDRLAAPDAAGQPGGDAKPEAPKPGTATVNAPAAGTATPLNTFDAPSRTPLDRPVDATSSTATVRDLSKAAEVEELKAKLARAEADVLNLKTANEQFAQIQQDHQKELAARRDENVKQARQILELEAANNDQASSSGTLRRQLRLAQENLVKTQEELEGLQNAPDGETAHSRLAKAKSELEALETWERQQPEFVENKNLEEDERLIELKDKLKTLNHLLDANMYELRRTREHPQVNDLVRRIAEAKREIAEFDGNNRVHTEEVPNVEKITVQKEIAAKKTQVAQLEKLIAATGSSVHSDANAVTSAIPILAQVTDIRQAGEATLVQFNVGSAAGMKPGTQVLVSRDGQYLGTAVVMTVDESAAVGRIRTLKAGAEVRAGDVARAGLSVDASPPENAGNQFETTNDNTELQPAANFRAGPVNPWTITQHDAQSTFALDVDTASYTLGRRYLNRGYLPPPASVRMEEYVNAFDYNYTAQCDDTFRIHAEAAPAPFAPAESANTKLLKIGVKGKVIGRDGRKPANLVFVVDTSGSMARADRLPMIQHSLSLLTGQLTPSDTVSLVTFGSEVLTLLDRTPASQKDTIISALNSLQANGPTNLLKGVQAGYRLAEQAHRSGAINRVIVCSDGIATLGETEADTVLTYVENYRKQGISCTTVGFGAGAYDDEMMEKLANKGDGSYYFVDSRREAQRVFVDELTATLQTIAKDAKIQVEFNPAKVRRYRLIGYENRAIADKDFRNDTIDAGEVGSGQSSTALYEVELLGEAAAAKDKKHPALADLGTVYVRYRNADTDKVEEIAQRLTPDLLRERTPQSDPRFFLAACAAEFAEILRGSDHAAGGKLEQVQMMLEQVVPQLPLDEKAAELLELVRKAQGLPRAP